MKKVIPYIFVITVVCTLLKAEEPQQQTKEPSMLTAVEASYTDQEATQALKKLEEEQKEETLGACPIKMADELHASDEDEDLEDDEDYDDDFDFDDEEDEDWDEDDYEDEDED